MSFHFIKCALVLLIGLMTVSEGCSKSPSTSLIPTDTSANHQPALSGRLIFHRYTCYACNDSKLYLFNFNSGVFTTLGANWPITNAMNAHFSPNGKKIVFMGFQSNSTNWDLFLWEIGSTSAPLNLTAANGVARDEDPKFSADGTRIVFKQNGVMKEMDTTGTITRIFTVPQSEASMPFYILNDQYLLYAGAESVGTTTDLFQFSISSKSVTALSSQPGLEEYYPIARDDSSFLFTRWVSNTNRNDQVYLGFYDGRNPKSLPFNETDQNFSDAYPVGGRYVIISSTRPGGMGAYDLYLADIITGAKWSLTKYHPNINAGANELGASYSAK